MTKLKSKKMTKSTFAIIIMAIVMVAMLAFGGTYAYFTATAKSDTKAITTGYVKLTENGALAAITAENVMPGDPLVAANAIRLHIDTTETAGNYVGIKFIFKLTKNDAANEDDKTVITDPTTLAEYGLSADSICATSGNGWYKVTGTGNEGIYIYGTSATAAVATTGETTANETTGVKVGDLVVNTSAFTFLANDDWVQDAATSVNGLMGAKIEITMTARSIQSSHVTDAEAVTHLTTLLNGGTVTGPTA